MDDEFKLCWKNFQDNIASGFQNLYDRGDLVDVTLACDGKLLHAHKIVLAICSPYFHEIFVTNPCKHPIIILKDVSFNIMCELLEFMYQGVVNVKHTELQSFMKIGQLLQIKGLATNPSSSTASTTSDKSTAQTPTNDEANNAGNEPGSSSNTKSNNNSETTNNAEGNNISKATDQNPTASVKGQSPPSSPIPLSFTSPLIQHNFKSSHDSNSSSVHQSYHGGAGYKRHAEFGSDTLSIYSRKQFRRSLNTLEHGNDHHENSEAGSSMDQVSAEDFFMPSIPHISMVESRYDLNNVKREGDHLGPGTTSASSLRNSFPPSFGFDYNLYKNNNAGNSGTEYPNELHMPNDYSKNFGNHMDIPPNGTNVVMLSSTSLLHGNCIFNRNNTVATQQGMKTYWLCKSYRISMCRARCITHQGRVISATGSHNHPPHMRTNNNNNNNNNNNSNNGATAGYGSDSGATTSVSGNVQSANSGSTNSVSGSVGVTNTNIPTNSLRLPPVPPPPQIFQHNSHGPNGQPHHLHNSQQQFLHQPQPGSHAHNPSNVMIPPPGHSHHIASALPNLLVQQHSSSNSQTNLPQHSNAANGAPTSQPQHIPNTVIHNMMHNANIMHLSNMPHMLHVDPNNQQSSHLSEHPQHPQHHQHPHQQNVGSNLEITRLIESSPGHMESPSNRSNQSHHGANSISSPLPMDSPAQANLSEDARMSSEQQQVLVNTTLSPSEMTSSVTGSSTEVNVTSQPDNNNDSRHQAHVINSITISPGNHSFKMENM